MNKNVKTLFKMNFDSYSILYIFYAFIIILMCASVTFLYAMTGKPYNSTFFTLSIWLVLGPLMYGVNNMLLRGVKTLKTMPVSDRDMTNALFIHYLLAFAVTFVPLCIGGVVICALRPASLPPFLSLLLSSSGGILSYFAVYTFCALKFKEKKLSAAVFYVIIILSMIAFVALPTLAVYLCGVSAAARAAALACGGLLTAVGAAAFALCCRYMQKSLKDIDFTDNGFGMPGGQV